MKKILMIVGSMRKASFNRQMQKKIEELIGNRAQVSVLEYADLPYMNQDIEFPAPDAVARVREEVQAADGIWICSPEYNGGVPGVLKNLLDWLSRPLVPNDWSRGSAAAGKPVTISGVAGKSAARYVRASLAALLPVMRMQVIGGEGTGVSLDAEAFTTGTMTFSDADLAALAMQADQFLQALEQ